MKLNKLLVLAASFMIGLSACDGPKKYNDESNESNKDSEVTSSETESTSSEESELEPFVIEGTSTGFPTEVVEAFLSFYGATYEIPAIASEQTWGYEAYVSGLTPTLMLYTEDNGAIGEDALEDSYKALLEEAGVTVDDTLYDYVGYVVYDDEDNMLYCFFTFDGEFDLIAFGPDLPEKQYDSFPIEVLDEYLEMISVEASIPSPTSNSYWTAGIGEDDNVGYYFYAQTEDEGAPYIDDDNNYHEGVNAIEDAYVATLTAAGWEIDDDYYEDDGYYADLNGIEINFYSWDGFFLIYIYSLA